MFLEANSRELDTKQLLVDSDGEAREHGPYI